MSQRIILVAPGRGSYTRSDLQSLERSPPRSEEAREALSIANEQRRKRDMPSITELDSAPSFNGRLHQAGENSSALTYALSALDAIDVDHCTSHEVVCTLGNSMGWYTSLFTAGALSFTDALSIVESMGIRQRGRVIGGQIIIPSVHEDWTPNPELDEKIQKVVDSIKSRGEDFWVGLSIRLGGFRVLAGTRQGIAALQQELPKVELGSHQYPFQLALHSAFHTPLMEDASASAVDQFQDPSSLNWRALRRPLIDGRGHLWLAHGASGISELFDYTFRHQILAPFDFSASVRTALREFNPDKVVLLGPGSTLGSSIAHIMIEERWRGTRSREDFLARQKTPQRLLVSLGRADQREDFFTSD